MRFPGVGRIILLHFSPGQLFGYACILLYSSAQDTSSPESSDSGIQTDHNSTSHIDSLLHHSMSSSCHHGNSSCNNNADDDATDVDNDTNNNNNNNSRMAEEGQGHVPKVQGQAEGQGRSKCLDTPADAMTLARPVQFDFSLLLKH